MLAQLRMKRSRQRPAVDHVTREKLGGEVLRGFSIAMLWGIVIGTYSSLFIAAPLLYYIRPGRAGGGDRSEDKTESDQAKAPANKPPAIAARERTS